MDELLNKLDQNLKDLYRKAVDADTLLDEIQAHGHGNYQSIFNEGLFSVKSNRFMPYLSETAEQIALIRQQQHFDTAVLERIVRQLQQLHVTLLDFKAVSR